MKSLVSIIVPVYNCEKYIERCLRSITSQSYGRIEILVVNDGSTDNSQEIIDNVARNDLRIYKLQQTNQGVAAARNYALEHAKGDYYLFVDGDDYIGTDYVKDLVDCANKNQSELVICGYTLVYPNKVSEVIPERYIKGEREEWAYRISAVCSRLYSSEFWKRNDLCFIQEKGARAEDVPLALFANAVARNINIIRKADYFYVQHAESAMHNKRNVKFLFPYESFEKMYVNVKDIGVENSKAFFYIGVLKFLAMFEFVLYKGMKEEKAFFNTYIGKLLGDDLCEMWYEWNNHKKSIDFPLPHKIAISLFCRKIRKEIR